MNANKSKKTVTHVSLRYSPCTHLKMHTHTKKMTTTKTKKKKTRKKFECQEEKKLFKNSHTFATLFLNIEMFTHKL